MPLLYLDALRGLVTNGCLTEVFVKISGVRHYLWRAVDQGGTVPDILPQSRREAVPDQAHEEAVSSARVLVADRLRSYGVAHRD